MHTNRINIRLTAHLLYAKWLQVVHCKDKKTQNIIVTSVTLLIGYIYVGVVPKNLTTELATLHTASTRVIHDATRYPFRTRAAMFNSCSQNQCRIIYTQCDNYYKHNAIPGVDTPGLLLPNGLLFSKINGNLAA